LLDGGHKPGDEARAISAAKAIDPARFDENALKRYEVGEAASVVSAIPGVRAALFNLQQEFAAAPPGAVLDGRDIGTVICPNADVKIFVTAAPEVRAGRRANELRGRGESVDVKAILADIIARDERDRSRATAPLMQAPDAHLLDTSNLDIEGAFRSAIALVERTRR
jgi:cytidylate kinase